jgi:hypothetical protein
MTRAHLRAAWETTAALMAQQSNLHRKKGARLTTPREIMPPALRAPRTRRRQPRLTNEQFCRTLRLLIPPGMSFNGEPSRN